jgi:early secretory antigenic target protein ESAT-6
MSQQVWNFAAIDGGIATLRGHAATINGQCEDLSGACSRGIALWEGEAGTQWAVAQQRLNARAQEFQVAMTDFINASEEAKLQMVQQEAINQSSFA